MKRTIWLALLLAAAVSPLVAACGTRHSSQTQEQKTLAFTASQKPSSVPAHVQTAEYLWSPSEAANDPSMYAPYLTWAYPLYGRFDAVHAAGIKTVLYASPLMPHAARQPDLVQITGQYSNLQAKDCGGNPVRSYGGHGFLLNVMDPRAKQDVRDAIADYADRVKQHSAERSAPIDLVFIDNANSFYGVAPMPCDFDAAAWTAGVDAALAGSPYPVVINTLSVRESEVPAKVAGLRGENVAGGMFEHCFTTRLWASEEMAQLQTVALLRKQHKAPGPGFWCYVNGTSADATSVTDARLFAYASFLLTYDPQYSVFQESYQTNPSTFKVFPETQFVPLNPTLAPKGLDDLRMTNGTYVRDYRYCYYRKKPVGACEIVVNPGAGQAGLQPVSRYRHSAVLTGGGVLDGGQMRFDAPAPAALAAHSAAILVP